MDGLPTDRVYEAYYGAVDEYLSVATRTRIHWICERAIGTRVLDVGCSQGIASLILGREGKKVDGIDVDKKSIDFAREKLLIETPDVQKRIRFIEADFLNLNIEARTYDTVIVSEILEHLVNPHSIIDKVKEVLVPSGRLLISVPFGINDATDHKKTYYGTKLAGILLDNGFLITDKTVIKNAWLCFACDFSQKEVTEKMDKLIDVLDWLEFNIQERERKISLEKSSLAIKLQENHDDLKRQRELEKNLQLAVQELTRLNGVCEDELRKSRSMILDLTSKLKEAEVENANLSNEKNQAIINLDKCMKDNAELLNKLNLANQKYSQGMQAYEKLKQDNSDLQKINKIMLERLNVEILEEKRILSEYSRLQKDRDKLYTKWNGFINSRTGKIVNEIWKIFNKIKYN